MKWELDVWPSPQLTATGPHLLPATVEGCSQVMIAPVVAVAPTEMPRLAQNKVISNGCGRLEVTGGYCV